MLANVLFDRSKKVYRVYGPDGDEVGDPFPSGVDGKRRAFQTAVALESPRLYHMAREAAETAPAVESRYWRACEIVLGDGVKLVLDGDILAAVQSTNEYGDYLIRSQAGELICECEDFGNGAPYDEQGKVCKHVAATRFFMALQSRSCFHCGTPNPAENMNCVSCGKAVEPF